MFHFMVKPRAAGIDRAGDAGVGGGLLGDGDGAGHLVGLFVEPLEEIDGGQILIAAVLVGQPLAGLARVIEIQDRGHGVHPQAVDVILLQPKQGVGDEEIAHFVAAEVEDQGAPVLLLAWRGSSCS